MSETSAPPFSFDCHRCGNCCRVGHGKVWFEESDLPAMARAFGIAQDAFVQRFVRRVGDRLSLMENADGSCSLLDGDSHCSIYEIRPKQCRDFPFWPQLTEGSRKSQPCSMKSKIAMLAGTLIKITLYSIIPATTPAPTVRPPSRMAKRSFSSMAMGTINSTSICTLSPGITISVPSGRETTPVTSVVRK